MSINPADSQIFGGMYGTDETRALFSDHAHLQFMLDVEAALARAESELGLVPAPVANAIGRAGCPVVALMKELGRIAGDEAARYIDLGATTQDILDTALVQQLQRTFAIMRRDLTGESIMAEAIARALAGRLGRAAAEAAVARACDRSIVHGVPLATILRDDSDLRPHLSDAEIEKLMDPAEYLGSARKFVDRVVARVGALR
jgi:adenylosuccinate lyase